jgi:hypothetical protein
VHGDEQYIDLPWCPVMGAVATRHAKVDRATEESEWLEVQDVDVNEPFLDRPVDGERHHGQDVRPRPAAE